NRRIKGLERQMDGEVAFIDFSENIFVRDLRRHETFIKKLRLLKLVWHLEKISQVHVTGDRHDLLPRKGQATAKELKQFRGAFFLDLQINDLGPRAAFDFAFDRL